MDIETQTGNTRHQAQEARHELKKHDINQNAKHKLGNQMHALQKGTGSEIKYRAHKEQAQHQIIILAHTIMGFYMYNDKSFAR